MRVVGMISGTSFDAIDVAAADLELVDDVVRLRPRGSIDVPYPEPLRRRVADVLPPSATTMEEVCRLDTELGQVFAEAAARGVAELCDGTADLVVSHGQTVFHWVEDGAARGTLQLGQPAWIAERTGLPVVSDLRSRDVAAGGHGAPLVSLFDVLLLSDVPGRGALNLGGIANLTVVGDPPLAYDLGPANALIDAACDHFHGEPYDADGRRAASGAVDAQLLARLLDEPYYAAAAPKSTGKELFSRDYLAARLDPALPGDDVIATVTELTAVVVARELAAHGLGEVFVSGGGTRNPTLMRRLAELAHSRVSPIDELGVPADSKEAYAFALLGFLAACGLPGTVPSCTGAAGPRVLGSVTPGVAGLPRPSPGVVAPRRLVVGG